MELAIRLEVDAQGRIVLDPVETCTGADAEKVTVPLPFSKQDSFTLAKALDLNASDQVQRAFSSSEVQYLRERGLLSNPPARNQDLEIHGTGLHQKKIASVGAGKTSRLPPDPAEKPV